MRIDQINDDCILHIASYLYLIDIVNLSQTCKRLASLADRIYRKRSRLDVRKLKRSVTPENLPTVLENMGPHIRSVWWNDIDERQFDLLSQYCDSVNELTLVSPVMLTSHHIKANKAVFKSIETLKFVNTNWYDISMKTIVATSNLKCLELVNCSNMQGQFFDQWKKCQLEILKIGNSPQVRNMAMQMCKSRRLGTLKHLTLDCNELSALELFVLRSLTNLKELTLINVDNTVGIWLYSWLRKHLPKIERLTIRTENMESNLKTIADMVASLPNLKYFHHSSMSWDLIYMIREDRQSQNLTRKFQFGITESMNDEKKVNLVLHILNLKDLKKRTN